MCIVNIATENRTDLPLKSERASPETHGLMFKGSRFFVFLQLKNVTYQTI